MMKQSPTNFLRLFSLFIAIAVGVMIWKQNSSLAHNTKASVTAREQQQHPQQKPCACTTLPDLASRPQVRQRIPLQPSPLNEPSTQELREFPGATVVAASEIEGPEPGEKTHLRILNTHFKYPNIRTKEIIDASNNFVVTREEMVADHFLVTLAPGEKPQDFFKTMGDRVTSMTRVTQDAALYRVELAQTASLDALPTALAASAQATSGIGEPDSLIHASSTINDPLFSKQWGLYQSLDFHYPGGYGDKLATRGINALDAWNIRTDASSVIVAVIDSGIRYTHEDLVDNIWNNPAPTADNDLHGWNAYANNGDPMDNHGHGTMCAGIIGATGNNKIGVCGVAWKVQLMGCKFMDSQGSGALSDQIVSADYAIDHGAKILNCSFGHCTGTVDSSGNLVTTPDYPKGINAEKQLYMRAGAAGVITVCSAGNGVDFDGLAIGLNNDQMPTYPASYGLDNIVSVAAQSVFSDSSNAPQLTDFSNYGAHSVHLAAPGEMIFSMYGGPIPNPNSDFTGRSGNTPDTAYAYMDGTSAAAPFVTGTLALMTAQFPKKSYKHLIARLLATTDKVPSLQNELISSGLLNAANALGYISTPTPTPTSTPTPASSPTATRVPWYEYDPNRTWSEWWHSL